MSRSKLSLPFSQACMLSEEQKRKLIECQAKRISIEEWELRALLDLCTSDGKIDKGLAVLYEYAGYMDDFKKVVESRSTCVEDVIDFVSSLDKEHGLLNAMELVKVAEKASVLTVKSVQILSKWRRLQCCPRPLYVEERMGGKWSFQFLLKDEAKRFNDALFQSLGHVNLFDIIPLAHLVALLAPFMEYGSFLDLVKYQHKYLTGTRNNGGKVKVPPVPAIDIAALNLLESPTRVLFASIREVVSIEDRIEASWEALRSLSQLQPGGTGNGHGSGEMSVRSPGNSPTGNSRYSPDPRRLYPVLRLPYRNFKPPTEDLAWFVPIVPHYLELSAEIARTSSELIPLKDLSSPAKEVSFNERDKRSKLSEGHPAATTSNSRSCSPRAAPDGALLDRPDVDIEDDMSPSRPAGAALAFARSRSSLKCTPQPGNKKNSKFSPRTNESGDQATVSLSDELINTEDIESLLGEPCAATKDSPLVQQLPSRGKNNNNDDVEPDAPSSSQSLGPPGEHGDAMSSPPGAVRKRSVTVAVVSQSGPSAGLIREAVELRRRGTHAGTMSSSSSAPAVGKHSVSENISLVLEDDGEIDDDEGDSEGSVGPVNGPDPNESITITETQKPMEPLNLKLTIPHSSATFPVQETAAAVPVLGPPILPGHYSAAQSSRESASPVNVNGTPQPIIKQPSVSSELGSFKRPSQIIRAASDGRSKTLSFDSILDDEAASPPSASGRPRNISYEIIYQESPEERIMSQQAYLQYHNGGIFQATPSPLLSRKRAQSTPLNLGMYTPSATSNTPFSPPVRHSPSFDAIYSPLSNTAVSTSSDYPARRVYHGRTSSSSARSMNSARRNFSARSRDSTEEQQHFMETFGMLDTLSKPYTRGESMAESQILHIALRSMRIEGSTLAELAARKICVWWRLIGPRKKLLRRMSLRDHCRDIIASMADSAVLIGISKQRRRRTLLRTGAAMRIQRMFRLWSTTVLVAVRRKELLARSEIAWTRLGVFCNAVLVAIRIYRYIRYWQQRRMSRKSLKLNAAHVLRRTIDKYLQARVLRRKLAQHLEHFTKLKVASIMSANFASTSTLHREKDLAVATIQKCFRAHLLRYQAVQKKYVESMGLRVTYFFIRCLARRRVRINKKRAAAAVVIQTFYRGIQTRSKILAIVRSGLLLNSMWRKHKEYVNLKSQLRRVDRPHTLVIHGIRNIAKKTINSDQIKFKVSVWWHPLLHIVSQNDINVIIQTKQPQYIYNSSAFYLVDTATPRSNRRMSFAQSIRALGSMITPSYRPSSAVPAQPVNMAARGVFRYSQVLMDRSTTFSSGARASIAAVFNGRGTSTAVPAITARRESKAHSLSAGPVGANASATNATPVAGGRQSIRKESVEVMRPSALAAQLAIIHSDDEEEEEDSGEANGPATPTFAKGKALPTRSFISKRMGVQSSPAKPSPGSSEKKSGSDSGDLSPVRELEDGVDSEGRSPVQKAARPWARVSSAVVQGSKPSSDLSLDVSGLQGDPNSSADWSEASHSPKPASHLSMTAGLPSPSSSLLLRSTLNFMAPLRGNKTRASPTQVVEEPKMICNFHDVVIKIPGCHGNSVIKIEILEGDRKYGNCHFYLRKEGKMMFWGGEYQRNVNLLQQRRAVQFNSHIINARNPRGAGASSGDEGGEDGKKKKRTISPGGSAMLNADEPILDFRFIAGAALRSKCSWGRVAVRGSGPLKRIMKSRDFFSSFLFDKWHRLYFSLDETGLYLFDNKFNTTPVHFIPVKDLKEVSVDVGAPIRQSSADAAKNVAEDIHNIKVVTFTGDDLYMRFPDTMTRINWQEALSNAIHQYKYANGAQASSRRAWVSKAVESDTALKGRGVLASALADPFEEELVGSGASPSPKKGGMLSIFGGGGGVPPSPSSSPTSHIKRLMRIRSETAMDSIVGGGSSKISYYGNNGLLPPIQPSPQRPPGLDVSALARLSSGSSPSNLGSRKSAEKD